MAAVHGLPPAGEETQGSTREPYKPVLMPVVWIAPVLGAVAFVLTAVFAWLATGALNPVGASTAALICLELGFGLMFLGLAWIPLHRLPGDKLRNTLVIAGTGFAFGAGWAIAGAYSFVNEIVHGATLSSQLTNVTVLASGFVVSLAAPLVACLVPLSITEWKSQAPSGT